MGKGSGACTSKTDNLEGQTEKLQERLQELERADLQRAEREEAARMKDITLVLLDLNGKATKTFQLKRDLQQEQLQALQQHICDLRWGVAALPDSWNLKYLNESDLVLSIGDAAISGEISLHQNGQCCLSDGCNPCSKFVCVLRLYRRRCDHCGCVGYSARSLAADEGAA